MREHKTEFHHPKTIADAVVALQGLGPDATVIAGGTWIMRAPIRRERLARNYVSIGGISELHRIDISADAVRIGSGVTHAQLARSLQAVPELKGLMVAASTSANPAIRETATVGGNLCTVGFPAADLVPALLCLDAEVEFATSQGIKRMNLPRYMSQRHAEGSTSLLSHISVQRRRTASAHARLTLRKAGDYPVVIVGASVELQPDGIVQQAAIAVGSVETTARRWPELEQALRGFDLNPKHAHKRASELANHFSGRDGPEVPAWYRIQVLPTLVGRAFESLHRDWLEQKYVDLHQN